MYFSSAKSEKEPFLWISKLPFHGFNITFMRKDFPYLLQKTSSMNQGEKILFYVAVFIIGLFFLFEGLKESRPFLAPLLTAVVLAMVLLPLSRKLERLSIKRSIAAILCTTFLFIVSIAFLTLISYQVKIMVNDWALIKQKMKPEIEQAKTFIFEHTPVDKTDLHQYNSSETFSFSFSSEHMDQAMNYMNNSLRLLWTFLLILKSDKCNS